MLSILPDRLVTQQLVNYDDEEAVTDEGSKLKVQRSSWGFAAVGIGGDRPLALSGPLGKSSRRALEINEVGLAQGATPP